ncbi:MAG TPA: nucleotidyltransferase domain-containing protein [Stellaceae bacterium]|nr:nucleotidyltransferase domain-containing protein [Stellaceae bacterium]
MQQRIEDDVVVRRLRPALLELYGDRLERIILFGSRARGDAREDSDYDVAVFLRDLGDRWPERERLASLRSVLLEEIGAFLDAKPFPAGAYFDRTMLMGEIRRDGVDL